MSGSGRADFDEFFAETHPSLVGLGLALTGDLQVAQELAQEALTTRGSTGDGSEPTTSRPLGRGVW